MLEWTRVLVEGGSSVNKALLCKRASEQSDEWNMTQQ